MPGDFIFSSGDVLRSLIIGVPAVAAATAKAASWAVKRELNGTAQRVKTIDSRTEKLEVSHVEVRDRLIRIETIVDERTA